MLQLVSPTPATDLAETVRFLRHTHEAALLQLTGEVASEADARHVFRTGVELAHALRALGLQTRPSNATQAAPDRYVVDVLASGAIRIQSGLTVKVETTPQRAAEYLLRKLLGPESVRSYAFNLGMELSTRGHWTLDKLTLAEWVTKQD